MTTTTTWSPATLVSCVAFFAVLALAITASAAPVKVRVRGSAKLTAHAARDQVANGGSELVLSGALTDDAGQPLGLQNVTVRIEREANPHDSRVAEAIRAARGCEPAAEHRGAPAWAVRASGPADAAEVTVVTDEEGRFCFRARLDPDRFKANLVHAPAAGALVDPATHELLFDLSKRGLALRFDPTPRILGLDTARTTIEVLALVDDDDSPHPAPALRLRLANEKDALGEVVTDASGRGRFALASGKLGSPGPGELTVTFDGDGDTMKASLSAEIERHVQVSLRPRQDETPRVPEDGIPLDVDVMSSLGPVAEGSVEARVGNVVVGTAPVERGTAHLLLTFAAQGTEVPVRLRYVRASPWYEPLEEPTVRIPIRGPGLLSKAPILVAGALVLAFFLFGRVWAEKTKVEPAAPAPPQEGAGKPGIEVLRPAERGRGGFSGRIVDAHDQTPIRGARIWIERGTFEGRTVLASAESDANGRFVLPAIPLDGGGATLSAEGRLHARFEQDVPPAGEIVVALALRKRALLDRLVGWAKRRGPPFDVRPEPTPGHVRRAAARDEGAAQWAEAVEAAAFGPGDVDALAERDVDRLAPGHKPAHESAPHEKDGPASGR
jgi:hypothetical protein